MPPAPLTLALIAAQLLACAAPAAAGRGSSSAAGAIDRPATGKAAMGEAATGEAVTGEAAASEAAASEAAASEAAMDKVATDKAAMDKAATGEVAMDKAAMDEAAMGKAAAVELLAGGAVAAAPPVSGALEPRPLSVLPADLQGLARALEARGFRVRIALPPQRQSYGLYDKRSRSLWISPLSFELGIGRQTFLHEATHAVQSCPNGVLRPIGWGFRLDPAVARGIQALLSTGYHSSNWDVEQEAFALQGQPDAVARLLAALKQRCSAVRPSR